jgi:hypothetical protein
VQLRVSLALRLHSDGDPLTGFLGIVTIGRMTMDIILRSIPGVAPNPEIIANLSDNLREGLEAMIKFLEA